MAVKKESKTVGTVQPEINIFSLEGDLGFDHFPHLNADSFEGQEQNIIKSMKQGIYTPFNGAVEYTATIETVRGRKFLQEAHPTDEAFVGNKAIFDKLSKKAFSAQMVKPQNKLNVKSRADIMNDTFGHSNIPLRPRYYHNPLQYFDHVLLSDAYVNSFAGTVIDTWVDFTMPKAIKPVLKLRNPKKAGDKKAQQDLIKKNSDIPERLEAIDEWYSDTGRSTQDNYIDIPLHQKFRALITNTLTFGRDAFVFENWKHMDVVEVDGCKYPGLPNVVKLMHPIDMGMVEIDDYSWKLAGMYVNNDRSYIPATQLLYLVNQYQSPMIGSMHYGFSKIQRALDPVRLLRRIFARNYQQFIRNSASGCGTFIFDSTQYPDDIRKKIRTAIKNSYVSGEISVIDYANIKDFRFEPMNIDVKISELQSLQEQLIKVIIGITGIPQSLIFDEAAATRATLVGRIVSFINNQIATLRTQLAQQISAQWYMRIFREVYKKDEDILETFYIGVEFEEMELETKLEKIGRLLQETQLNQLTNDYIGEQLGDANYLEHIDEEKNKAINDAGPMGNGGSATKGLKIPKKGQFSVTDSSTGQSIQVSEE